MRLELDGHPQGVDDQAKDDAAIRPVAITLTKVGSYRLGGSEGSRG